MKKGKLNLNELKVKSFVTDLENHQQMLKGGVREGDTSGLICSIVGCEHTCQDCPDTDPHKCPPIGGGTGGGPGTGGGSEPFTGMEEPE